MGQIIAQTSRISDGWSAFFLFANPGHALIRCEVSFQDDQMIKECLASQSMHRIAT